MAELDMVLSELERIVAELRDASREPDEVRKRLVVSSRQRMADRMHALVRAAGSDPRLPADSALAAEFSERMTRWRHALAEFQAKWRVHSADVESAEYSRSVTALRHSNQEFLTWARGVLAR